MSRAYNALSNWARLTASAFSELRAEPSHRNGPVSQPVPDGLVYRLKQWPLLPAALRTADVLRLLSLMTTRPVNRHWMANHTRLPAARLDALLRWLSEDGALEVINISGFAPSPAARG